jgi:DnaJ family protein B protein 12
VGGPKKKKMSTATNKDEGLRCMEIARRALENGDFDKAVRFADKAFRLYPAPETKDLQAKAQESNGGQNSRKGSSTPSTSQNGPSTVRSRTQHRTDAGTHTSTSSHKPEEDDQKASPEQRTLVATIRSKTCYYEILGVSKTATDDDIKRAYRKLALKLHPDKNKARGADEAFKSVSRAFTCLSDPTKRRHYDVTGTEMGQTTGMARTASNPFGPFAEDEIDPEEIFRMFFGGNPFMGGNTRVYSFGGHPANMYGRPRPGQPVSQENAIFRLLLSLAPIILLVLLQILSRPAPRPFSLQQSRAYPFPVSTAKHRVPFYVANEAEFLTKYPLQSRERSKVEYTIETEWRDVMQQACYQERVLKRRYEYYGHKDRAAAVNLESCNELSQRFGGGIF